MKNLLKTCISVCPSLLESPIKLPTRCSISNCCGIKYECVCPKIDEELCMRCNCSILRY